MRRQHVQPVSWFAHSVRFGYRTSCMGHYLKEEGYECKYPSPKQNEWQKSRCIINLAVKRLLIEMQDGKCGGGAGSDGCGGHYKMTWILILLLPDITNPCNAVFSRFPGLRATQPALLWSVLTSSIPT